MTDPRGERLWRPYTQMKTAPPPLEAVRTEGSRIHLADGRVLVDGIASWWTACHGYAHPHIRRAVEAQLAAMPHVMFGGLTHAPAERLATRLADLLPGDLSHVFFSDSGSVAVEVAMKAALQFHAHHGRSGRTRFVGFRGGYHGDTLGTMSVCDPDEGMHARFGAALPPQLHADLPRTRDEAQALDALLQDHRDEVAAVIVEPLIQGAGGMLTHAPDVLAQVAATARRHGALLIADEVFTGFGRTGSMFACEQAEVVPDLMCLSKALTGGTSPLAATVATHEVFEAFWSDDPSRALMHGPTFMAHPLGCAAANASLDLFAAEPRLEQARAVERRLADALEPVRGRPGVADVRVLGAMGAVEFEAAPDLAELKRRLLAYGVWVRPFGRTLYLTPALNIDAADLETLTQAVLATAGR